MKGEHLKLLGIYAVIASIIALIVLSASDIPLDEPEPKGVTLSYPPASAPCTHAAEGTTEDLLQTLLDAGAEEKAARTYLTEKQEEC